MADPTAASPPPALEPAAGLRRQLGVWDATLMGLGSILGTGVFVSIGIAAGVAGPAVILATALAALVAVCNALSSAQLAANHPVAGGTYEYGYRYLTPALGFTAGWTFLCAKTASAATAALGFAGYLLHAGGGDPARLLRPVAAAAVICITLLVLSGLRRSSRTNTVIVTITLVSLVTFVIAGLPRLATGAHLAPFFAPPAGERPLRGCLEATALMFVAYTGYGRIATMGEEVRDPQQTIPRAILIALAVSAGLYIAVAAVAVGILGAPRLSAAAREHAAPLEIAAGALGIPALRWLIALGAVTAMLGVLLNLVLGLSRVVLAMARRQDLPSSLARVDPRRSSPWAAVLLTGALILGLVMFAGVKTTWSFSAFTVLIYYAITNLAALRLPPAQRLYSPAFACVGLLACLALAFWVEQCIWLAGLALIGAGLAGRWIMQRRAPPPPSADR